MRQVRRRCWHTVFLMAILSLGVFASLPQAHAGTVTETRYFGHGVNVDVQFGMNVYREHAHALFLTENSVVGSYALSEYSYIEAYQINWGIRVWEHPYNYTIDGEPEIEITDGEPIAIVTRYNNYDGLPQEGYQSATWTSSNATLNPKSSLVIRVYVQPDWLYPDWIELWPDNGELWSVMYGWMSEATTYPQLKPSIWNVTYYTYYLDDFSTEYFRFYYGDSSHESRIENIQYDDGITTGAKSASWILAGVGILALIGIPASILLIVILVKKH